MKYDVVERGTNIWGLKYAPSIEPTFSNDDDHVMGFFDTISPPDHYSLLNQQIMHKQMMNVKSVLEIGVFRPAKFNTPDAYGRSSTGTILRTKDPDCVYLGIDKHGKKYLDNEDENIHTFCIDSLDHIAVRDELRKLGVNQIDLLVIDGWHSVTHVLSDWRYTEWLSPTGIVVFHDTNVHPGPVVVFDAVDEALFDKQKFGENETDWGIGICKRI